MIGGLRPKNLELVGWHEGLPDILTPYDVRIAVAF